MPPSADPSSAPAFETEPPSCPFGRCDMGSNHDIVGRGWDFEYHSTHQEIDYLQCRACQLHRELAPGQDPEDVHQTRSQAFYEIWANLPKRAAVSGKWHLRRIA